MKRKPLAVIVLGLLLSGAAMVLADGDIYVGGPWGTRITSLPYTISGPGAYYLGGNLSYDGTSDGITISSDDVTLDLMGFSLNYTGSGSPNGIYMAGRTNVEIRNGAVRGWDIGIREDYGNARFHRIINVRVAAKDSGIFLSGGGHLVRGCEVSAANPIYILHGTVSGCTVKFIGSGFNVVSGLNVERGITSGNVVTGGYTLSVGISSAGPGSVVRGNEVAGGATGIFCGNGAAIIGNTVKTESPSTGIVMNDVNSNLLDQNTVLGPGTHYSPSTYTNAALRNNY